MTVKLRCLVVVVVVVVGDVADDVTVAAAVVVVGVVADDVTVAVEVVVVGVVVVEVTDTSASRRTFLLSSVFLSVIWCEY